MVKLLTKESILAADDLKTVTVDVPEWGGAVRVSQINAGDRLTLQTMILDEKGNARAPADIMRMMTVGLLTFAIVDDAGNRLFTLEDIEALGKKSSAAIDRVFEAADELNGISAEMAGQIKKN